MALRTRKNKTRKASRRSNNAAYTPDCPRSERGEALLAKSWVKVLGVKMLIPRTYDPDTYDPDSRMSWTPEPEPYDSETYAAWGRKHFGEEWYTLRKTMLEERELYVEKNDPVYSERQRELGIMEYKAESRPFRLALRTGEERDPGWTRVWARLSKKLGIKTSSSPPSPASADYYWIRSEWRDGSYHSEKVSLNETFIDIARTRLEDEPGDRLLKEQLDKIDSFRMGDRSSHKGWTREQINARFDADISLHEWRQKNPEPAGSGSYNEEPTPEAEAAMDAWKQKRDAATIHIYGAPRPIGSGPFGNAVNEEERDRLDIWLKNIYTHVSRQQQQGALCSITGPDALGHLGDKIQTSPQRGKRPRKVYQKGRASRRLAGAVPEYGGVLR
ncbi:hypothetical protein F5Y14DRAFT_455440 [Nemania sp. NC0429]|nr:hypothetical protein F5Y14DRAFT_455440 [Nemania sp. NC0429]